jgi:hypothetical protein
MPSCKPAGYTSLMKHMQTGQAADVCFVFNHLKTDRAVGS